MEDKNNTQDTDIAKNKAKPEAQNVATGDDASTKSAASAVLEKYSGSGEGSGDKPTRRRSAAGRKRGRSPRGKGRNRERSEFDQRIINIRRVTRVVAGGRRFSFSVAIVVGDRKGKVGVGVGKANDTALAIEESGKRCQEKDGQT